MTGKEDTLTFLRAVAFLLWDAAKAMVFFVLPWVRRYPGMSFSLALHVLIFLLLVVTIPSFYKEPALDRPIAIEVLPVRDITNVQPQPPAEKPQKALEKPKPPVKTPPPKPVTPPADVKPQFKPKPPAPKVEKPKPEVKKEEKPKERAVKKDDFDALLKSIDTMEVPQEKKAPPQAFDPNRPLSVGVIDAIIGQISKCWSVPAGARDAAQMAVRLHIVLEQSGAVRSVQVVEKQRYNNPGETFFRASADAAIRAVYKCSPLKGLPADQYQQWKEMELNFDPQQLIY